MTRYICLILLLAFTLPAFSQNAENDMAIFICLDDTGDVQNRIFDADLKMITYLFDGYKQSFTIIDDLGLVNHDSADQIRFTTIQEANTQLIKATKTESGKAKDQGYISLVDMNKLYPAIYLYECKDRSYHLYKIRWVEAID